MKKLQSIILLFVCGIIFMTGSNAVAKAHEITLNPVTSANVERCVPLPSGIKPIEIMAVKHKGADESVGVIKKKGEAEKVFVINDVKQVVMDSVRNTLTKCGYKVASGAGSLKMELLIEDFFTRSENEGVTGKDTATMNLTVSLRGSDDFTKHQINYNIEKSAKTVPFMKAKRFAKILNATLMDIMNQIAMSQTLAATVKSASNAAKEETAVKKDGVIVWE